MAASKTQRALFGKFLENEGKVHGYLHEEAAGKLREWYRRGQRAFRECLKWGPVGDLQQYNDLLFPLRNYEREGFLMGWQSDAWAYDNGKQFSVEGTGTIIQESNRKHTPLG